MLGGVIEGALEAMAADPPDLEQRERWETITAREIEPLMVINDPSWAALALGQTVRIALVESMLAPPHDSLDAELGMITFLYVDALDTSYRSGAAYLPDTVLQRWIP